MNSQLRQKRNQRMASIRTTLKVLPVVSQKTLRIQQKFQKLKLKHQSSKMLIDPQTSLPKDTQEVVQSDQQHQPSSAFRKKYQIGDKIGQGAHGVVYKCYNQQLDRYFAVKTFILDIQHLIFLRNNFVNIKNLRHEHIIKYKSIFFQMKQQKCHLVMQYAPHPNLHQILIDTEQKLKLIAYQLVETLVYIHANKICHRDIKPQNILFDQEHKSVKIIDFGISKRCILRHCKREMLTLTGTPYYRAPQMFQGDGYDQRVDMWALGVTMFQLMVGRTPFQSQYQLDTIRNIVQGKVVFPENIIQKYSRQAINFVLQLLKKRDQRLTATQALRDIWFMDIRNYQAQFTKSLTLEQLRQQIDNNVLFNNSMNKLKELHEMMTSKRKSSAKGKDQFISCKKTSRELWGEEPSVIFGFQESKGKR